MEMRYMIEAARREAISLVDEAIRSCGEPDAYGILIGLRRKFEKMDALRCNVALEKPKKLYKWVEFGNGYSCPKCGERFIERSNFCPECGAKFEREAD